MEHGGCLLWRPAVEVEEPWEASFVAAVGVEGVGPVGRSFSIDQVPEEAALTSGRARLTVELEDTKVGKHLAILGVSHLCAVWQLCAHFKAPDSSLELKAGKSI